MNPLFVLLMILLAVLLIGAAAIFAIAAKNIAAMNRCMDTVLTELRKHYTLTPVDPGEFKQLTVYRLIRFNVEQYNIEGLGNLCIMRVNMGAMQMATAVITPRSRNLPLFSIDYMFAMSKRKAYLEFYDVVKEKDVPYMQLMDALGAALANYDHLEAFKPAEAWYDSLLTVAVFKSATAKADPDLLRMLTDSLQVYLAHGSRLPPLSDAERAEKHTVTTAYTNGMIDLGGVCTDIFKKQLGVDATRRFFDRVMFGTAV